tara:strand:- start:271 stop:615 length:345 start_codon:yes stop_codon:yes gene_type:complete
MPIRTSGIGASRILTSVPDSSTTTIDKIFTFLYNNVTVRNISMTVITEDGGRTNLFAREPRMYVSQTDAERYGYETHAERAEKLNGRTAMLGFVAAVISYATSGSLFFFGIFGF